MTSNAARTIAPCVCGKRPYDLLSRWAPAESPFIGRGGSSGVRSTRGVAVVKSTAADPGAELPIYGSTGTQATNEIPLLSDSDHKSDYKHLMELL
jgi:hypothetical protein